MVSAMSTMKRGKKRGTDRETDGETDGQGKAEAFALDVPFAARSMSLLNRLLLTDTLQLRSSHRVMRHKVSPAMWHGDICIFLHFVSGQGRPSHSSLILPAYARTLRKTIALIGLLHNPSNSAGCIHSPGSFFFSDAFIFAVFDGENRHAEVWHASSIKDGAPRQHNTRPYGLQWQLVTGNSIHFPLLTDSHNRSPIVAHSDHVLRTAAASDSRLLGLCPSVSLEWMIVRKASIGNETRGQARFLLWHREAFKGWWFLLIPPRFLYRHFRFDSMYVGVGMVSIHSPGI